jgi:hypothetical protein
VASTILGNITLGYHLLWNQLRHITGVQLFIAPARAGDSPLDAGHLLAIVGELWATQAHAPTLLLSPRTPQLLHDLLLQPPASADNSPWLEVSQAWLGEPALAQAVRQAQRRGHKLVWRGEPGQRPDLALAPSFHKQMLNLTPEEALLGLRVSLHKHNGTDAQLLAARLHSPVESGQIYEAVASRALIEHCLDQQGAWAVAGWPLEDVLHGYRQQLIQPSHRAIVKLTEAINRDESMDTVERLLSEEPVLTYRFLRYANSAAVGLRTEIDSLRHGLMVLGFGMLKKWLLEQLPKASSDMNLLPIRSAMVLRAHLMENLLDAGAEDDLRRELYLCGLLSQIDLMLGEPLGASLQRIPLASRINSAILGNSGPYLPYLDVATALESPHTQRTQALCNKHKLATEHVNRALLKTLASAQPHPAKGLLLV